MKTKLKTLLLLAAMALACTARDDQAEAAGSTRILIAVPGVEAKIPAQVDQTGTIVVEAYPEAFQGTLELKAMTSATFGRTLNDAACQAVQGRAALAADETFPEDLRALAKDSVRKDNSFTLSASVVSFFATAEFQAAAKAAAEAAGVRAPAFHVENQLTGRTFQIALEVEDGAISKKIGDLTRVTGQLENLLVTDGALSTGRAQGEISAADLMCDLRSGDAKIKVTVDGKIDAPDSVEPIFDEDTALLFFGILKDHVLALPQTYTTVQRLVAGGYAVNVAASAVRVPLDHEKLGVIAAKLFDPQTGKLVYQRPDQVHRVLVIPRDGGESYQGHGTLVLK